MSKWFVLCLMYVALALEGAATPPPPTQMTPAGLQSLVRQYSDLVEVKKVYNESVGKDEFVVDVVLAAPKDLLASKQALAFFLNSEDDRGRALASVEDNGTITIRQDMSPIQFLRGFTYEGHNNGKAIVEDREKLAGLAKAGQAADKKTDKLAAEQRSLKGTMFDKIDHVNGKATHTIYGIVCLVLVGAAFGYGAYQEIQKLKYVKSGQMDKDEYSKTRRVMVDQQRQDIKEQVSEKTNGFHRLLNEKVSKESFRVSEQTLKDRLEAVEFDNQETKEILSSILSMTSMRVTEETAMFSRKQTEVSAAVVDKGKNGKYAEAIETTAPIAALPEPTIKPAANGHVPKKHVPVPNTEGQEEEPATTPEPPLRELPMELSEAEKESLSLPVQSMLDQLQQNAAETPYEGEPTVVKKIPLNKK